MENGIDLNKFYQGLDDLFQQKDSGQTMAYLQRWLQEAQQRQDTSGIVAVSKDFVVLWVRSTVPRIYIRRY